MRDAVEYCRNALGMREIKARELHRAVLDKVHEMPQLMRHGRQRLNRVGQGMPLCVELYRSESGIVKALDIKAVEVEAVAVISVHPARAQTQRYIARARNRVERYNALLAAYLRTTGAVANL